ncbi:MAG TPA: alpha/beta hydrolase, partial [Caulobacteraceae bacterium]|nr:alpha/beta hydrolase [Caulobacteraceae bacterium]
AALTGCAVFGTLNALSASAAVTVTRDIAYGRDPRQRLDVYAPPGAAPGRPVVVFFYGGSWDSGSKANYAFVGEALARRGYLAVVANYRLFPQVAWPAFLMDCGFAVKWARDHAAEHGGDPGKLVVMGLGRGLQRHRAGGRWPLAGGRGPGPARARRRGRPLRPLRLPAAAHARAAAHLRP